jgi:hexosaminidase
MKLCRIVVACLLGFVLLAATAEAQTTAALRLVPMPKEIHTQPGQCSLAGLWMLQAHKAQAAVLGEQLAAELQRAGLPAPKLEPLDAPAHALRLVRQTRQPWPTPAFRRQAGKEDYWLSVAPQAITVVGHDAAGLFYGVQTLRQLLRANRRATSLPCLVLRDWPALRWRAFMDDMTRGPSATLATLQREAALGAELKMNLFTYYMEYQYAFKKHPQIGPPNGALEPDELRRLVRFVRPLAMDVLGSQQSFGHFGHILAHQQYAPLRESADVLTPVNPDTYRLLDDLYSEVIPLLPFPLFNVCCDETWSLGTGPSKPLADQIGVGGVYAKHLRRVHDLLAQKYGKRMMMWGDIILKHPEHLVTIPKDTVMLTWGYSARDSFAHQILPFTRSGYEFFVCPGVNNWSRILPDFSTATTNIGNFVRDGVHHGALGMLNTEWKDDGETLRGPSWHGYAWGAECAWTGSTTAPEDFDRRIGAVLFGEPGDHFGQAIALLGQTHRLAGTDGMYNRRFWEAAFLCKRPPATLRTTATRVLELVRPAINHLETCRRQAQFNADLLDAFLLGARRMERIALRDLDALEAVRLYGEAWQQPAPQAAPALAKIMDLVRRNRQAVAELGQEFARLWNRENRPYALDWTMRRYQAADAWYEAFLTRLDALQKDLSTGRRLPAPENVGLAPVAE